VTIAAVSIIMAVRNAERYLARALDSIAAQTFRDYEVVIVDGNSSDGSLKIARSYPQVRCLQQAGDGFTGAWNEGLDGSKGPFVAFLDSDDIWPAGKLATQMSYFAAHPDTDCVVGRVRFFLEPGVSPPPGFRPMLLDGSHIAYIPGVSMVRREVFSRIGNFEERWTSTSDLVWFAKMRELGMRIGVIDDVLLDKRVHGGNLTYTTPKATYQGELTRLLKESLDRRRTRGNLS